MLWMAAAAETYENPSRENANESRNHSKISGQPTVTQNGYDTDEIFTCDSKQGKQQSQFYL